MSKRYRIHLVPGDGIGKEVIPEGVKVLDVLAAQHGFGLEYQEFPYSCEYRSRHGRMMPEDGIERLSPCDAIYLGAVGYPGVPDHVSLWELLIPIRRCFEQYICVRPVRLLPGIRSPLANRTAKDIDFVVVRENNEGEYSEIGGRTYRGTEMESANQLSVFSRHGVDRVLQYGAIPKGPMPEKKMLVFGETNSLTQEEIADLEAYLLERNGVDRAQVPHPGIPPKMFFYFTVAAIALITAVLGGLWARIRAKAGRTPS